MCGQWVALLCLVVMVKPLFPDISAKMEYGGSMLPQLCTQYCTMSSTVPHEFCIIYYTNYHWSPCFSSGYHNGLNSMKFPGLNQNHEKEKQQKTHDMTIIIVQERDHLLHFITNPPGITEVYRSIVPISLSLHPVHILIIQPVRPEIPRRHPLFVE